MFVATTGMGEEYGPRGNVAFEPWVVRLDSGGRPLAEDLDLGEFLQFFAQADPAFLYSCDFSVLNIPGDHLLSLEKIDRIGNCFFVRSSFDCYGDLRDACFSQGAVPD